MKQLIVPHLWFDMNAAEAMNYYVSVFPNSRILDVQYYPEEALSEHFEGMRGKVIQGVFELDGQRFQCLDGGKQEFEFNEAISFIVWCKDQDEIDHYWSKLSDGEHEVCGWCKDKFGVHWQVLPENMGALQQNDAQIQAMLKMKKIIIAELEALA